jgi:hypothetical protein
MLGFITLIVCPCVVYPELGPPVSCCACALIPPFGSGIVKMSNSHQNEREVSEDFVAMRFLCTISTLTFVTKKITNHPSIYKVREGIIPNVGLTQALNYCAHMAMVEMGAPCHFLLQCQL